MEGGQTSFGDVAAGRLVSTISAEVFKRGCFLFAFALFEARKRESLEVLELKFMGKYLSLTVIVCFGVNRRAPGPS